MSGFTITTPEQQVIHFECYTSAAPHTCAAFMALLPLTHTFYHARISGQEIWIDKMPPLDIMQENASVFTEPGEVVLGPSAAARLRTVNCLGIYYGEGKGLDACNIFAKVRPEDHPLLKLLGERIWKEGGVELRIEALRG